MQHFTTIPDSPHYLLKNVTVPVCCLRRVSCSLSGDHDGLCRVDVKVHKGSIASIKPASTTTSSNGMIQVDLNGAMCWPSFVDIHTHIDKGHTCERSRNPTGNLSGADRSTASDANFWDAEDVYRRMDFSLRCAYAHGTSAVRTHLINMTPKQTELTWPVYHALRSKWAGKVELQGVALVVLSYFRNKEAATKLADTVQRYGGVLGAAVCCAENGGDPDDDWTTCDKDRDELLEFIFTLAKERDLDLDFHTDENGNELARGLRYVAEKAIKFGYQGRVVCGHCCSLAYQPEDELTKTLSLAREAQVTVVSLPLVNEWTQDRDATARRTPRWRGITTLHELRQEGVLTAIASDNTRDQFYAYGDLDMLEVFTQAVRIGQLDRPYSDWPCAVTAVPAAAMKLPGMGVLSEGGPADLVLFRARRYSELLSRPQVDRIVIRHGRPISERPPSYEELDYEAATRTYLQPLPSPLSTSRTESGTFQLNAYAAESMKVPSPPTPSTAPHQSYEESEHAAGKASRDEGRVSGERGHFVQPPPPLPAAFLSAEAVSGPLRGLLDPRGPQRKALPGLITVAAVVLAFLVQTLWT